TTSWPRSVGRPSRPDPSPATSSAGTRPPGATSTRRYSAAGGSARKPRRSGPSWRSSPADGLAVGTRTARPAPKTAPARAVAALVPLSPAAPPAPAPSPRPRPAPAGDAAPPPACSHVHFRPLISINTYGGHPFRG